MHYLCRCLWLCSDTAQGCIFSPVVVVPDLVLCCGMVWAVSEHLLSLSGDHGVLVTGILAAALLSEVWASGVLFESAPTTAAAAPPGPHPMPPSSPLHP